MNLNSILKQTIMTDTITEVNEVKIPLTRAEDPDDFEDDLDATGIVDVDHTPTPTYRPRIPDQLTTWDLLNLRFARIWRLVPSSWSVERDPSAALRHVLTLSGFLFLCIFIFSVPSLLYVVSPRAPTPPGTSPDLDEAASMISGKNGAVAADNPICSELGVKVLRDMSGTAVDAMVSTVLCQGILSPFASGLGGGAFILTHEESTGISTFYDARETAPKDVNMARFKDDATKAKFGGLSVAVPGELMGLYRAHQELGRLNWSQVVLPAIKVAEEAKVGKFLAIKLQQMNKTVFSSPSLQAIFTKKVASKHTESQQSAQAAAEIPGRRRDIIMGESLGVSRGVAESLQDSDVVTDANDKDKHGVRPKQTAKEDANATYSIRLLEEGDKLVNAALVETLKNIAEKGPNALYVDHSEALAKEVQEAGGVMTKEDLQNYHVVRRNVLTSPYQGFEIIGAPPPSAGGATIAMALNMITELQFRRVGRNSVSYQMLTETLKWVFGARMGLADPDFVQSAKWQSRNMMSRREAMRRVYRIQEDRTHAPRFYSKKISTSKLEHGTSHVSIVDKDGLAVSVTSTINLPFGAGLVSKSSGVILNDEMDAFTTSLTRTNAFGMYPSAENTVSGGKRPLSSMCPTIVLYKNRVYLVLGGSGGPKAVSGVLQTLVNVIDYGDSLSDAISAPRVHHQLVPNVVSMEGANGTDCKVSHALQRPTAGGKAEEAWPYWKSVCEGLLRAGHRVRGPAVHGAVQAVLRPGAVTLGEEDSSTVFAASDARRIGKAAAY